MPRDRARRADAARGDGAGGRQGAHPADQHVDGAAGRGDADDRRRVRLVAELRRRRGQLGAGADPDRRPGRRLRDSRPHARRTLIARGFRCGAPQRGRRGGDARRSPRGFTRHVEPARVAPAIIRSQAACRQPRPPRFPPHARLFRGRRPAQGRHRPCRQRRLAAGRGGVRQAPEGQGGRGAAALRRARRRRRCSPRRSSSPPSSTRTSCGRSPGRASSASTSSPASTTGTRRRRSRPPRSRRRSHAAPMYFYKRGKGRYRKAPPDALKAALASIERKRREARADRRLGRRARAGPPARRAAGDGRLGCCTGPTRSRSSGRRWPPRATRSRRTRWRCSPPAARSRRRTSTTSTRS